MTELAEMFVNIFMLSDYRGHFTLKCAGTRNVILSDLRVIYNGAKSITGNNVLDGGVAG